MGTNVRIEIDEHTADVLRIRAAELGVTVSQLVAQLATFDSESREASADEIAELDRRSAKAMAGSPVPHERVVQWLRTWGTSGFRPWPGE
jgi:predicted transcriptional regulator